MDSFTTLYKHILKENNLLMEEDQAQSQQVQQVQQVQQAAKPAQPATGISLAAYMKTENIDKTLNLDKFKEAAKKFQEEFPIKNIISLCILPAEISIRFPEKFQPRNYKLQPVGTSWNTEDPIDTDEERKVFEKFITGNPENPFHPLFYKELLFYIRAAYKRFEGNPAVLKDASKNSGLELLQSFGSFGSLFSGGFGLGKFFQNHNLPEAKQKITKSLALINSLIKKINDLMQTPEFSKINELATCEYEIIKIDGKSIKGPGLYSQNAMEKQAESIAAMYNISASANNVSTATTADQEDARKWREYIQKHPEANK